MYLDGQFESSVALVGDILDNIVKTTIGEYSGDYRNFNGSIDQVRIYNRTLTSTEISELYNENTATTSYQCSDSIDNDGDGLTDYPNDPGCTSTTDNDETDVVAPPADTTPPTISAVTAGGITTSSATITWTTNEGAHTELNYSDDAFYQSTASYNNTSIDWSYITSHTVTLTGLSPSTTYHYQIKAQDISSNNSNRTNRIYF